MNLVACKVALIVSSEVSQPSWSEYFPLAISLADVSMRMSTCGFLTHSEYSFAVVLTVLASEAVATAVGVCHVALRRQAQN